MAIDPNTGIEEQPTSLLEPPTSTATVDQQPEPLVTPEATVSQQLSTLLASDSPYIKETQARSKEQANQLGLLSSSLAVGSGQKAAIQSALPIAQQDASTFAQSDLSRQVAGQNLTLAGFQGDISSRLQAEQAAQRSGLSAQEAAQQGGLLAQEAEFKSNLQAQAAAENRELSRQEADARFQLEKMVQDVGMQKFGTEMKTNIDLAMIEMDARDRQSYSEAVGPVMQQYQAEYQAIQTTADTILDASAKRLAIEQLNVAYKSQVEMTSALYQVPVDWTTFDEGVTSVTNTALNEANTATIKDLESQLRASQREVERLSYNPRDDY